MRHNTDTLYTVITGGTISSVAYLFGGLDKLLLAFVILMACDFITGVLAAFYDKRVSSKNAYKGLAKKGGMFVMIIAANVVDQVTGSDNHFMRNAMIMFLIATEGISLIENLGRLDVTVPKFLSQAFSQLKDKHEGDKK
ncbi:phage holin family protein [Bacillus sp. NTK034]|uniref:phage holin family protein n=1 Tax=Bacillus sp. NTK034 TaxID=2802176 RepID=UPI001A900392|nr:phage holin family protein [Bacillus sp. NTK034]MBN8200470.1 phage holin family protein [Bacillus sp. NTK034]